MHSCSIGSNKGQRNSKAADLLSESSRLPVECKLSSLRRYIVVSGAKVSLCIVHCTSSAVSSTIHDSSRTHRYQFAAELDDGFLLAEVDVPVLELVLLRNLKHLCACFAHALQALEVLDRHCLLSCLLGAEGSRHVVDVMTTVAGQAGEWRPANVCDSTPSSSCNGQPSRGYAQASSPWLGQNALSVEEYNPSLHGTR